MNSTDLPLMFLALALVWSAQAQQPTPAPRTQTPPVTGAPQLAKPDEVKPEDYASIEGTVTDARTGQPLSKAHLTLFRVENSGGQRPTITSTDAGGRFVFRNVEPGNYRLSAERNRYARQEYGQKTQRQPGTTLTLSARQQLKDIAFRLQPGAVITGKVLDEDGEPLAGVDVMAMAYHYMEGKRQLLPLAGFTSTNDLGEYRMFGVPPGSYYFSARYTPSENRMYGAVNVGPDSQTDYPTVYYPGVTDPGQTAPIRIRPGEERAGIDFRLTRGRAARIKGRIVGGNVPFTDILLMLMPKEQASWYFQPRFFPNVDRRTGAFEITGVSPGSYVITASTRREKDPMFARVPIEVVAADVENVRVVLSPAIGIRGQIKIESDSPSGVNLAELRVFPRLRSGMQSMMFFGGSMDSGRVEADGTFSLTGLAPDRYQISVFQMPEGYYLKAAHFGDSNVLKDDLNLEEGAASGTLDFVLSPYGGRVEGQVLDAKKQPFSGALVVLVPEQGKRDKQEWYKQASSDQNGRCTLQGIPPGDYKLYAWDNAEPGAYLDPAFLEPYENSGKKVTVSEKSQQVMELELITVNEN